MFKRIFDFIFSIVGLLIFALPMLLIAAAVRLESRGGAIFRQRRVGRSGKLFTMLKFRTMQADVEPYGSSPHSSEDSRLTRIGRFLRQTSLDELPQLFNVLAGQMSLVGPRPIVPTELAEYAGAEQRLLSVKPGITGYWQINGRSNVGYPERIRMDMYYLANRCTALDLSIVSRTFSAVIRKRGAF